MEAPQRPHLLEGADLGMGMLGVHGGLVWFLVAARLIYCVVAPGSISGLRCLSSGRVSDGDLALPYLVPVVVKRYFISLIDGSEDRRYGAVEVRRPMRGDGLAQEEVVVWRHGDVDGRVATQGKSLNMI